MYKVNLIIVENVVPFCFSILLNLLGDPTHYSTKNASGTKTNMNSEINISQGKGSELVMCAYWNVNHEISMIVIRADIESDFKDK